MKVLVAVLLLAVASETGSSIFMISNVFLDGSFASIDCPQGSVILTNPTGTSRIYIWSNIETPTLLFASMNSSIDVETIISKINCSSNISAISSAIYHVLPKPVSYSFATLLPYIVEFDDGSGSGLYGGSSLSAANLSHASWNMSLFDGSAATMLTADGLLELIVTSHDVSGRDDFNPFLAFNEQSASVSLVVSNYNYTGYVAHSCCPPVCIA